MYSSPVACASSPAEVGDWEGAGRAAALPRSRASSNKAFIVGRLFGRLKGTWPIRRQQRTVPLCDLCAREEAEDRRLRCMLTVPESV